MAENDSFFRKVVRFVANPATDWKEVGSRLDETRELEVEKTELKNMIERKRRNDFVRKREFDMLRQVRREGLTPEQLAALGGSSRLDDPDLRSPESAAPRTHGVKAKIDAIEQQMVGDAGFQPSTRGTGRVSGPSGSSIARSAAAQVAGRADGNFSSPPSAPAAPLPAPSPAPTPAPTPEAFSRSARTSAAAPLQMASGLPPLAPLSPASFDNIAGAAPRPASALASPAPRPQVGSGKPLDNSASSASAYDHAHSDFGDAFAVEVNEVVHDPELDEAVIAFANADFNQCEQALQRITAPGGPRADHAETWLVLFDLYRATGQHQHFESLAVEYAHQFGWSAPQWYSLPRLVADALAEEVPAVRRPHRSSSASGHAQSGDGTGAGGQGHDDGRAASGDGRHAAATGAPEGRASRADGDVGWLCPPLLDIEAVAKLRSQTLQLPLPWIFDWSELQTVDAEAAMQLSMVMRLWAGQALEMRWIAGERLFQVLQDAAPAGVRDADPAFWLTRLDALRLVNRADRFDEAAIDYCVTYEVSPPSWEATRCRVQFSGSGLSTRTPSMSMVSDVVSTSFVESRHHDSEAGLGVEVAHVELSGQLVGDIGEILTKLQQVLTSAPVISVSCARLIRVDFIAAGDLLNWVLNKRTEHRAVHFVDAHRLVALFFGAMGINEHARVQVRKV